MLPLLADIRQTNRDLAHPGRDVLTRRRALRSAHDIDQHRTDELSGLQRRLDLAGPVRSLALTRLP